MRIFSKKFSRKIYGATLYKYRYKKFIDIKKTTNGYLSPKVYHEIYSCARRASDGNMVDIGPAQGGSSIALGLGIRDSNKRNAKVYSIEKGQGSDALSNRYDIEANLNVYLSNIKKYNLKHICQPLMGDVSEVESRVDRSVPISLIFIDADGAIDRDFHYFFNYLVETAPVIIDDYSDIINKYAQTKYLKWKSKKEIDIYVKSKGAKKFVDLCPLGKEYSTYKFVNYLLDKKLIVRDQVVGTTFFGYKNSNAIYDPKRHGKDLMHIRTKILNRYFELNPYLNRIQ